MQPNSATRQPFLSTHYSERTHLKTVSLLYFNPLNHINRLRMVTHHVSFKQNLTSCPLTDDKESSARLVSWCCYHRSCAVCVMCNVSGIFCTSNVGCRQLLRVVLHRCDVTTTTEIINRIVSYHIFSDSSR